MNAAAITVDPRIQARRVSVLRAEGRRRLRILVVLVSVVLAGAGVWCLSLTPLLDVDRIAVAGAGPARSREVLQSSRLSTGLPMLFLDIEEAERSIGALPWVKSARVRREWPGTVHLDAVPRVPVAVVPADGGRTALIDANGYAIAWDSSPEAASDSLDLPYVSVPFRGRLGAIHTDADPALAAVAAMPSDLRAWARTVTVDQTGREVDIELQGGATAVLGEPILLDDKMSSLRAVLAGTELDCIVRIDVTMPDIVTVARHPSC